MDSWNLFSKIDYLIGIDVQIRVTFNINVTTNFSIYLLHLSFSPQKKKHQIFFGYLRIRSQIPASEIATFLILMMQVHLRGHVRISIQIDICAVLSMMWTCYEMQRGENITVEKVKTGKRVSGSGAFTVVAAFPLFCSTRHANSNVDGYALLRPVITIVIIATLDL